MGYTDEVQSRLSSRGASWQVMGEDAMNFGKYFKSCLEENRISKAQLAQAMSESPFNSGENQITYDSLMTKLTRWINGKTIPEDRSLMLRICIYIGLSLEKAREFFEKGLRASWVHPANREELIYGFCIENGFGINAAYRLVNTDYGSCDTAGLMDMPADRKHLTNTNIATKYINSEYKMWSVKTEFLSRQERLAAFEEFLRKNNSHFHNMRMTRTRLFSMMVDEFKEQNSGEVELDETNPDMSPVTKYEAASNTMLADRLRAMRVPSAEDIEALEKKGEKKSKLYKLVRDNKMGDSNPIRKDIPLYLSGERDIPRDIFIKMYILSEPYPDFYDLEALLMEAGYPSIYVRAADGFDALVYHIFTYNEQEKNYNAAYEKDYLQLVSKAMKDLKKTLDESDI